MKAVIRTRYGPPDVLQVKEIPVPAPAENEVLVNVRASSLNKADMFQLRPPLLVRLLIGGDGRIKPKRQVFGMDLAGVVEAVGAVAKRFKPGDEVFGCSSAAFAEYACAREDSLALKSQRATFEDSASLPVAGITALQALRKAKVQRGQRVLIDGASGGVGTFALQIAKSLGADVTAVCSARNMENVKSMGADRVIDYTKQDFAKEGQTYDTIVEVNGYRSLLTYRRALNDKGIYMLAGSSKPLRQIFQAALLGRALSRKGGRQMGFMGIAKVNPEDLTTLMHLLEVGKVKPSIDAIYPLTETAEAFRYFAEGHTRGKVVLTTAGRGS